MDNHKKVYALSVPQTPLSMHKVCANATNFLSMMRVQYPVHPALTTVKHVALPSSAPNVSMVM